MNELKEQLTKIASEYRSGDEGDSFNACCDSGGNYDDCRSQGYSDGQIDLARELLIKFFS